MSPFFRMRIALLATLRASCDALARRTERESEESPTGKNLETRLERRPLAGARLSGPLELDRRLGLAI